jgi:alpha-D-ribose 1-methylphosphonate 5-triphosphate synthase subunit PhnG
LEIFSDSTTLIEVSRLSRADQDALERAVEAVEAIVENIRAAQAGIVIVPAEALPKVRLT